ncbi:MULTISPECIES: DMT family transporter [Apilactobacillus]|uniref:QacE family quaternary ammonium compound efflux SMR transporter n=2 Tax=Apilactobacillus TaxID=2767877 RepID=A0A9Q8IN26_9LACO|nr:MULTISPECIES: multidrug efflux SMR transporter [Apilactobacillus]TPR14798.1 QacE family quaternary ammonium compound efflux SMR transporter [Apilactobacillus timberlakei]TPR15765.1 QacE family quaternary ammonium compound efflux SMR transporter [Apilactobacillus timberlakei]TPR16126.1 QacE family quaternary ammonium compound efflux SMR transporter [Apilactobacillus timberlakei]TPR18182.1 QacE family quaternary ammonium compound efflux SMR transporter [Apilactobacillus timberlakei]TPR18873.1
MFYYLFLGLAIIGEIIGTNLLKMSMGFSRIVPAIGSIISFILCFYFLSIAMIKIPLNITYADWSAIGILVTTIIAIFVYKEPTNIASIIGVAFIIVGVILLNLFSPK